MLATISAISRQKDVSQISVRIIIDTLSERVVSLTVFPRYVYLPWDGRAGQAHQKGDFSVVWEP